MIVSAFTEQYDCIQRRLINSAVIEARGNFVPVRAQWDTGATGTCISKDIVSRLNLLPTGMVRVHTPTGTATLNKYLVNLVLNNEIIIPNVSVMDSEIGNQGIDVLIGMDIISHGDFAVSNFEGKTQFSFRVPSREHADYSSKQ